MRSQTRPPVRHRLGWFSTFAMGCLLVGFPPGLAAAEILAGNSQQLSAALRDARPGDRIVMRDGAWADQEIAFRSHGTPEQPITLCAQTPGGVVLTGKSSLRIGGRFLIVEGLHFAGGAPASAGTAVSFRTARGEEASDCRLTQCAVTDYSPADRTVATHYIALYGRNNRVDHCYFSGKTNQSAVLSVTFDPGAPPNHHRIDRNHFGRRAPFGANGAEIIQVGWSAAQQVDSRTVVEHNYFEECSGEVEIITNKSCENSYRHNTFVRCEGALSLRVGNRCVVEGNFFLGENAPRTGGVHVFGEDHRIVNNYFERLTGTREHLGVQSGTGPAVILMNGSSLVSTGEPRVLQFPTGGMLHPQVKRAVVAFNTFVDCAGMIDVGVAFAPFDAVSHLRPSDCTVANNLVVGTPAEPVVRYSAQPENLVCEGNLIAARSGGRDVPVGFRGVAVRLARDAAGVFRPEKNSPAIGAAVGEHRDIRRDIDGQPRPDHRKDVGCDQFSTGANSRGPLTPRDVGPRWLEAR